MNKHARSFLLGAGFLTLVAGGALADNAVPGKSVPATTTTPPVAPVAPATVPAPAKTAPVVNAEPVAHVNDKGAPTAPPDIARRELLEELKKANTQLAEDKKAAAEAAKGKDKDATKAAQDKVKADGKAINEINQKLHALKGAKPAAPPAK